MNLQNRSKRDNQTSSLHRTEHVPIINFCSMLLSTQNLSIENKQEAEFDCCLKGKGDGCGVSEENRAAAVSLASVKDEDNEVKWVSSHFT